ncbi:MAG: 16S rRNA (cytosine(1402)-N(4))-methyltransferase RsmH [Flavobacteriales bacterium]
METANFEYHIPVLLRESVDSLGLHSRSVAVDVTYGGGGHARYMRSLLGDEGKLYAFDQDEDAHLATGSTSGIFMIRGNFKFLKNHLHAVGVKHVDAILADIGVSSHQFDVPERGFSFRTNAKLDMRMNRQATLTASTVLNEYSEEALLRVFNSYCDIANVYKLVQRILSLRGAKLFEYTDELASLCLAVGPKIKAHKYQAQVFQALRIEVNDEIDALKQFLLEASEVLRPGGRIAVISYHSIEDRLVKSYFKKGSFSGEITKDFYGNVIKPFVEVNRHPIVPSEKEISENARARSAKLRIAEKQ